MAAALTLEIRVGGGRCKIYCGYNTGSWPRRKLRYVACSVSLLPSQGYCGFITEISSNNLSLLEHSPHCNYVL